MQNMQSTILALHFLVGNCMSTWTVMFTFKSISVKSKWDCNKFTINNRRYCRNMVWQNRRFTVLLTVNKSMNHSRAFWIKTITAKSPEKRGIKKHKIAFLVQKNLKTKNKKSGFPLIHNLYFWTYHNFSFSKT